MPVGMELGCLCTGSMVQSCSSDSILELLHLLKSLVDSVLGQQEGPAGLGASKRLSHAGAGCRQWEHPTLFSSGKVGMVRTDARQAG